VVALDGLNLDVPEGAIYGLVGPNGAGKTTTIKIVMNIIRATSGTPKFSASIRAGSRRANWPRSATYRRTRRCPSG
jgi:ABC-2 type transport system ATP-binding protein